MKAEGSTFLLTDGLLILSATHVQLPNRRFPAANPLAADRILLSAALDAVGSHGSCPGCRYIAINTWLLIHGGHTRRRRPIMHAMRIAQRRARPAAVVPYAERLKDVESVGVPRPAGSLRRVVTDARPPAARSGPV